MRADYVLSAGASLVPRRGLEQVQIAPNRFQHGETVMLEPVRGDLHLFQAPPGVETGTIRTDIVRSYHSSWSRGQGVWEHRQIVFPKLHRRGPALKNLSSSRGRLLSKRSG